jgi:hypothetical protein
MDEFQAIVSGRKFGYVYVMSYPGSDKLKIGHSLDPFDRAEDIGGTKAPENPIVEAVFWCSERREDVERAAHKIEQTERHNGEWFNVSVERAMETIRNAAAKVNVQIQLVYDRGDLAKNAAAKNEIARQEADEARIRELALKAEVAAQMAEVAAQMEAEVRSIEALIPKCMSCHLPLIDPRKAEGNWVSCRKCGYSQILRK